MMLRLPKILILLTSMLAASAAGAENIDIAVHDRGSAGLALRVSLNPDFTAAPDGADESVGWVTSPGGREVPAITRLVAVPAGHRVLANVTSRESRSRELSKSEHIDLSPISAAEAARTRLDPPAAALVGEVEVFRGVPVAPVTIYPVQYSNDEDVIIENISLEVELTFEPDVNAPVVRPIRENPISTAARLKDSLLLNPPQRDQDETQYAAADHILIIHQNNLSDPARGDVANFVAWKRSMGFEVDVEEFDVRPGQGVQPLTIRNFIRQNYYHGAENPISYLIIIGSDSSSQQLYFPYMRQGAYSGDHYYSLMDDNDRYVSDIAVGRFFAFSRAELRTELTRSILYEREPYIENGDDWFARAIYTAEDVAAPGGDFVPSMIHLGRWVFRILGRMNYEVRDTLYSRTDSLEALRVRQQTREKLEQGRGLAFSRGWLQGSWDIADAEPAQTGRKNPFVMAITCYSMETQTSFFRAGTHNNPHGSVAAVAIHGLSHSSTNNALLGGAVRGMHYFNLYHAGWIANFGKYQMFFDNQYELQEWVEETFSFYTMLGDPSLGLFTSRPVEITAEHRQSITPYETGLDVRVEAADGNVSDAWVSIWQEDGLRLVTTPGDDGWARFTFETGDLDEGELGLAITRQNGYPYRAVIAVEPAGQMISLEAVVFDNQDGLFGNGESIPTTLTLLNIGEDDLSDLFVELSTEDEWVAFSNGQDPISAGDIASGESVDVQFELALDRSSRAGRSVRIAVGVYTPGPAREWTHAFDFVTAGHLLDVPNVNLGLNDLFRRGETVRLYPELRNRGDLPMPAARARLESLSRDVQALATDIRYPALNPNDVRAPDQGTLRIRIDEHAIPATEAQFRLLLSAVDDGDSFRDTVYFSREIEGELATAPYGPDEYGYMVFDSFDEGWDDKIPTFDWVEINPNKGELPGNLLELGDYNEDMDSSIVVSLPFTFNFYGESFDTLIVCSNGWIAFGAENSMFVDFRNQPIPGAMGPDAMVAALWQDLINVNPEYRGVYSYYHEESESFIVEWSDMKIFSSQNDEEPNRDLVEIQIILYNPEFWHTSTGDGEIKIQYKTVVRAPGSAVDNHFATVGLKNLDGSGGLQYTYWDQYPEQCRPLENNLALLFTTDVQTLRGSISGRAVLAEDHDRGVEGVTVEAQRTGERIVTDAGGNFSLENIAVGLERLEFRKRGFSTEQVEVVIREGEESRVEVFLTHPELVVSPEPILQELQPGEYGAYVELPIGNTGTGDMEFSLLRRYTDGSPAQYARIFNLAVTPMVNDGRLYGSEFVGDQVFITGNNVDAEDPYDNRVYVVNREGGFARQFRQPAYGEDGFADLAYDGEFLYGGDRTDDQDSLLIVVFDTDGNRVRDILLPLNIQQLDFPYGLAWNAGDSTLFIGNGDDPIYEVTLAGEIVGSFAIQLPDEELNIQGLAWNAFDNDRMPLYIMDRPRREGAPGMRLIKTNPRTRNWTVVRMLTELNAEKGTGLSIGYDWERSRVSLAAIVSVGFSDSLRIFEMGVDSRMLASIEPRAGVIPPGGESVVRLLVRSDRLALGDYTLGLMIDHNAASDSVVIPLTLRVTLGAGVGDGGGEVPFAFELGQAYPNPFNSSSRIMFTLPQSGPARLAVYDITGREVASLIDGAMPAGRHAVSFDARSMPSGIYFYRLQAAGGAAAKRFVLLR